MAEFTDQFGDKLTVREWSGGAPDGAAIEVNDGDAVNVPPHKVPEVCRAIYEAAGLPAPELPEVLDADEVDALAKVLQGAPGQLTVLHSTMLARAAMLAGWRKQEGAGSADDH